MIDEIVTGISIKLNQVFGDNVEIYADSQVQQGLKEPCFFVAILNPSQTKLIDRRYFKICPFDIHYFPKIEGDFMEMHNVASELFDCLEYIELLNGDLLHGTSMGYEIQDSVLHFKVNYNMHLYRKIALDPMEDITIDEKVV